MTTVAEPIAAVHPVATPRLTFKDVAKAIEFYQKALGATEMWRFNLEDRVGHAEIKIGDSYVMLPDQHEQTKVYGPKHYGGVPGNLMVYVEDVDSVFKRAVDAGATVTRPLADQFYGDRNGGIEDPFGHHWFLATHIQDVSPEEMKRAMEAMAGASA